MTFTFLFSKTCITLENKLALLQASLLDVDQELSSANCRMDEQSIGYDKSLLITLEQARTTFGENQGILFFFYALFFFGLICKKFKLILNC